MEKIRAMYVHDIRFDKSPVFELDKTTNKFRMLTDLEIAYFSDIVLMDKDWIVFKVIIEDEFIEAEIDDYTSHSYAEKLSKKELREILFNN